MQNTFRLLLAAAILTFGGRLAAQGVDDFYAKNPTQNYNNKVNTNGDTRQPEGYDPNLWVFLCFGQSNMEGNARAEAEDMAFVDPRFLMLSAVDMPSKDRIRGHWYVAYPPLCGEHYGLSPADYFGRTMVERLPDSIRVAVINVAVGGASINLFDEEKREAYISSSPDWLKGKCRDFGNNPFRRLVESGFIAQQYGCIKGILLHQGCTDNGQKDWPLRVDKVYHNILDELSLKAEDVPLLVGELMTEEDGGCCFHHNAIIDNIAATIPTASFVSAKGCEGKPDKLHFTAKGYRELGRRYAEVMLKRLGR